MKRKIIVGVLAVPLAALIRPIFDAATDWSHADMTKKWAIIAGVFIVLALLETVNKRKDKA